MPGIIGVTSEIRGTLKAVPTALSGPSKPPHHLLQNMEPILDSDLDEAGEGDAAAVDDEHDDVELREQSIAAAHEEGGTAAVAAAINRSSSSAQRRRPTKKLRAPSSKLGRGKSSEAIRGTRVAKRSGPRLAKRSRRPDLPPSDGENDGPQRNYAHPPSGGATQACVDLDDSQASCANSPVASDRHSSASADCSEDEDGSADHGDARGAEEAAAPMVGDGPHGASRPHRRRSSPASYRETDLFKQVERRACGRPLGRLRVQRAAAAAMLKPASSHSLHPLPPEPKSVKKRAHAGGGPLMSRVAPLKQLGTCFIEVEYGGTFCEFSTDWVSNCARSLPFIAAPNRPSSC